MSGRTCAHSAVAGTFGHLPTVVRLCELAATIRYLNGTYPTAKTIVA